jgi:Fic family protein
LLNPRFDSPLVDLMTELEHLRRLHLGGTTPKPIFFQLKEIFHMLESLGSARIEGNHTTLADYVESRVDPNTAKTEQLDEIGNIEHAMRRVEDSIAPDERITEHWLRSLHETTVQGLTREGDPTPGAYRTCAVSIAQSAHLPPDAAAVPGYMAELVDFINREDAPKYHLMKVALAHHRFGWIHPFRNGNGRVVRLLTYALLLKYGFTMRFNDNVNEGRIMNPTAVFCNDREAYYDMLGTADLGDDQSLEVWCRYVLDGMLEEMKKIDRLTRYEYLQQQILLPAISAAKRAELINTTEEKVLTTIVRSPMATIKAGDLKEVLPDLNANQRTYQIRKLLDDRMIMPISENARQYTLRFANSKLLRDVIKALTEEGFTPKP